MGFKEGNFPPVDPAVFLNSPLQTRMRTLAQHWGEYGFGTARNINVIYIFKIVVLYALAGVALATIGVSAFWPLVRIRRVALRPSTCSNQVPKLNFALTSPP
mgnify:CR=1 FL=1